MLSFGDWLDLYEVWKVEMSWHFVDSTVVIIKGLYKVHIVVVFKDCFKSPNLSLKHLNLFLIVY